MPPRSRPPTYELCQQLAEAGKHEEARSAYRAYLRRHGDDGRAFNDLGALLYASGEMDEAAECLRQAAARLGPERGQALWNLAEVYLAAGRPAETLALFPDLAGERLLTADLANRTAVRFLDGADRAGAIEALRASLGMDAGQDAIKSAYQAVRAQRPKVAFFVEFPDAKFLGDIFRHVGGRFEVRLAQPRQARDLADLLAWCDIAWFEWCTSQVVVASRLPKTCRTIVRLHRFEAYGPWPEQVRWENVDALLTVGNPATLDHLKARVPDLDRRTRVLQVPNGVDLERFAFADRPRGKHLAWVGNLNEHKNPMLALQGLASLRAADPEYRLFFAGEFQDTGYLRQYMSEMVGDLGLSGAVQFDGWQKDVAAWLRDKHYLVTSSIVEGHPVGALEAMACGLKPVIHAFPGCRAFFPDEFLYRTVDEFCERILRGPYEPRAYRDWVAGRFPLKAQLDRIGALLLEFERCPAPRPTAREARAASAVDAFLEEVAAHGAAAT